MTIQLKSSDAGRSINSPNEKRDCTVRAYAAVTGLNYLVAHAQMQAMGRKNRRGFRVNDFFDAHFGKALPTPHMTVENYIKYIAHSGKWIIDIRGHVFAVIDGAIIDEYPEYNLKCHVIGAWRVSE